MDTVLKAQYKDICQTSKYTCNNSQCSLANIDGYLLKSRNTELTSTDIWLNSMDI